ncbi:right-handed parallel beta-helix repeat-containing protein [Oleiharenicola lentus]|jgi:parallel beta-helix repeat protein|nr:right-handed parallel beta-helix repeat-containing protein [Oleiharenicola lentus]
MSFPFLPSGWCRRLLGFFAGCLLLLLDVTATERARRLVMAAEGEPAVHAALAALPPEGGIVELGAGTFRITHPIILDRDGVELRGQGVETKLVLGPKANCPVVIIGREGTRPDRLVRRVTVRLLFIDGNRAEQEFECWGGPCDEQGRTAIRNNGITIRGAEDVLVEDVSTVHARSGGIVLEKHCRRIRLARVEAYENEFDGVAAYETEDSEFTALNLHRNRSAGFSFDWRFNRNRVTDCNASDNGSQGIFMRDSIWNVFERLTLNNNGEQGIFMAETRELPGTACRYNRFSKVTVTGNRTQGIRINDRSCNPNTIEDSLVRGNRLEDVSLADFGQLEIVRPREN